MHNFVSRTLSELLIVYSPESSQWLFPEPYPKLSLESSLKCLLMTFFFKTIVRTLSPELSQKVLEHMWWTHVRMVSDCSQWAWSRLVVQLRGF